MTRHESECPHCGQPLPEPYTARSDAPRVDPAAALLDDWNRQVSGGMPSHPASVAAEWIRPVLPALQARAGDGPVLPLWSDALARWLAQQGGKRPILRWFCRDLPDLLVPERPPEVPRTTRLFPVLPVAPVEHDPDATAEGLRHVRDVLRRVRG